MAMSRKHFTVLAEIIGGIEAGRIGPTDVREVFIENLLEDEPSFKREKFDVHTTRQRDTVEMKKARSLVVGETFQYGGLVLRADEVGIYPASGEDVETVRVRTYVDGPDVDPDAAYITLYLDADQVI